MMCCFCNFSYVSWHFNDLQCQALRPDHILAVGMAKVRKVRDLGEVEVVPLLHGAHSTEKSSQNIHPCHGDPGDPQEFTIPQSSTRGTRKNLPSPNHQHSSTHSDPFGAKLSSQVGAYPIASDPQKMGISGISCRMLAGVVDAKRYPKESRNSQGANPGDGKPPAMERY